MKSHPPKSRIKLLTKKNRTKQINEFAVKWLRFFKLYEDNIGAEKRFVEECAFNLDFITYRGKSLDEEFPNCHPFWNSENLKAIINAVDDVPMLGNAIFHRGDILHKPCTRRVPG